MDYASKAVELSMKAGTTPEAIEAMEKLCEFCRWPILIKDQLRMADKCEGCEAVMALRKALRRERLVGAGDGIDMVREAMDEIIGEDKKQ